MDVPSGAAAGRLGVDDALWHSTDWPTHAALVAEGRAAHFGVAPAPDLHVEAALVFLPKGRERIRMMLALVAGALPPGAPLWVVGARRTGIESAADDLRGVADPERTEVGRHARLLMARVRGGSAPDVDAWITPWTLTLGEASWTVASLPGVFSHGRLDDGTRLLLQACPRLPGPLLDVGCGAGVLGVWYALQGTSAATLVDADACAVVAARRTAASSGVDVRVEPADVFPSSGVFTSIVSNPPFHRGVDTDHTITERLVRGAPARLTAGGTLTLVCNRFLPVQDALDRAFGAHEVLADDGRYRVYRAESA